MINESKSFPNKFSEKAVGSKVGSIGVSSQRTGHGYVVDITNNQIEKIRERYGLNNE